MTLAKTHTCALAQISKLQEPFWANYIFGVIHELHHAGHEIGGFDLAFGGNLPRGGGVSSSAALENGIGLGLSALFNLGLKPLDIIHISKKAENHFVGLPCGIMDMFASMLGKKNHLIKLNCQDLAFDYVPFPSEQAAIVLCNTMIKHALVDGEFSNRAAQCQSALAIVRKRWPEVAHLSDLTYAQLLSTKSDLSPIEYKRTLYIVEENQRLHHLSQSLLSGDMNALADFMHKSHAGLRDNYEVSCEELNFLVDTSYSLPYCLGARMLGGGFGGCTLNLIQPAYVDTFIDHMQSAYHQQFGIEMEAYQVEIGGGTELVGDW